MFSTLSSTMIASKQPSKIPSAHGGRRDFLTRLAGVAALGAVPFAISFGSRSRGGSDVLASASAALPELAAFVPHLGTSFIAAATESQPAVRFTLAKAEALKQHQNAGGQPYSLRFAAPAGHVLESRIYQLQHPVLGSLELFISPVGSAERFGQPQKGEAVIDQAVRLV